MTVQELIDALNKIENKSKDFIWFLNDEDVHCMQEHSYTDKIKKKNNYDITRKNTKES